MSEALTFIIPTFNNPDQLQQCVDSLLRSKGRVEIIIVNNGSSEAASSSPYVKVINTGENLGWEGGLVEGLKHTTSKYVVFCNDDVFLPQSSYTHFVDMVEYLEAHDDVGAIGPSTNVAMGFQNIWSAPKNLSVTFLIGFCMVVRREALEKAGGIDDTAPGGDDIDLSIRLRDAGYRLVCYKDAFIYHHGFQTGVRVHGSPDQPKGWNSPAMTERTNDWLIRKHGFLKWWNTMINAKAEIV